MILHRLLAVLALLFMASRAVLAEPGVTPDRVVFGQVAALSGPAAALGSGMREGLLAAFEEANRAGGVHGRKVELVSHDDGYEPVRSADQVREAIQGGQIFGLVGSVGTPTAAASQPVATAAGMPYIGPFTGAGFLRNGALDNVINLRASYGAETEAWIAHLVDKLGMKKIAILYQDDGFGRVGLAGVREALARRDMTLVGQGAYVRNTTAVKAALLELRQLRPQAVVMVGAYAPIARFIQVSRTLKFSPIFVTISFVGSDALAQALGDAGEGVIISQVVPFPWDDRLPVVADYHAALVTLNPDAHPGFVTLEGYLVGRLTLAALEQAGPDPTRDGFLSAFRALGQIDLGGLPMHFAPGDNQGLEEVFLTRITAGGGFESISTGPAS
ncbi:ABC transporter substrate-binding protein [Paroceanicella profunda]|uniref:ABC transporter substrate-binding protein n=1 Tax=Paroceanicella profunda TaxID=2579971 RepID=A0A5B8FY48_9RHOB|nr:ABC transporter substrate-binding protein [Paroceanicella profunda]QDL93425.1 ABC transporter substrate-binding protein [Paroceanicella profunda]